jgi:ssDNA-binding Zn-finger/Zn-ribbon topoisomerase 1
MLRLKSCPRCKGDILMDRDHFGWYEQCIQCGYQEDLEVSDRAKWQGKKVYMNTPDRIGFTTEVAK